MSASSSARALTRQRKKLKVLAECATEAAPSEQRVWEPPLWREQLENIQRMRSASDAPVDTLGAGRCVDKGAPDAEQRFQILLSLMLSSQTKDAVTTGALQRLIERGCRIAAVAEMAEEEIGKLIYPVSFWKTKAQNIRKAAETLRDKYNADIPSTVEELCNLKGVGPWFLGPKMAHLTMELAWNNITGIAVDTHVHRICNRLGWTGPNQTTPTPETTRVALESWLPRDFWGGETSINHLVVGFGQQVCLAVKPKCGECLNVKICPFAAGRKAFEREVSKKGGAAQE